jgi:hypothetical protein
MDNSIVVIFVGIFLQISFVIFIYASSVSDKDSILNKVAIKMPITAQFLVIIGIFITYLLFRSNVDKNVIETTIKIEKNIFSDIYEYMNMHYAKCPHFIDSINRDMFQINNNDFNEDNTIRDINVKEDENTKITICNLLFNNVEMYYYSAKLTKTSDSRAMRVFISFLRVEYVQKQWEKTKYLHSDYCRMLIDWYIQIIKENHFNTPEDFIEITQKLVNSDKFKYILNYKSHGNVSSEY